MATHGAGGWENAPKVAVTSLFSTIDSNGDRELDATEVSDFIADKLALPAERADAALLLMDKDGSGGVDVTEFTAWLRSPIGITVITDDKRYAILSRALELFQRYDADGSRTLSKEELGTALSEMGLLGGDVTVDSAFEGLDSDNDGVVSFAEFLTWLNWLPAEGGGDGGGDSGGAAEA